MLNHHTLEVFICWKKKKWMEHCPLVMYFPVDLGKEKKNLNAEEMKL